MSSFLKYVFCKRCGIRRQQNNRLFIASCKHLFCKNCVQNSGSKCAVCLLQVRFLEIGPSMPPNVRAYLEGPKKEPLCSVKSFQIGLLQAYNKSRKTLGGKLEALKKEIKSLRTEAYSLRVVKEQKLIERLKKPITSIENRRLPSRALGSWGPQAARGAGRTPGKTSPFFLNRTGRENEIKPSGSQYSIKSPYGNHSRLNFPPVSSPSADFNAPGHSGIRDIRPPDLGNLGRFGQTPGAQRFGNFQYRAAPTGLERIREAEETSLRNPVNKFSFPANRFTFNRLSK